MTAAPDTDGSAEGRTGGGRGLAAVPRPGGASGPRGPAPPGGRVVTAEAGACRPRRVGMLTPSSNTVLEPVTSAVFAATQGAVTAHFARFRVVEISTSETSRAQFAPEPILEAAARLAEARVDCMAWNGTASIPRGAVFKDHLGDARRNQPRGRARAGVPGHPVTCPHGTFICAILRKAQRTSVESLVDLRTQSSPRKIPGVPVVAPGRRQ